MDDTTTSDTSKSSGCTPLGMSSFDASERQQFGQSVRLAMACIKGAYVPVNVKAMPDNEGAIRKRLKTLSKDMTSNHADLLELLVRFDEMKGWESAGANHCAAWMNLEMGICKSMSWEYLRVGRLLRQLPVTTALFRVGKITWSKIRVIVDVANADNEKILCHAALDASVSEITRLCKEYKWKDDSHGDNENERALKQHESRSLTWNETSVGCTSIRITLPPEIAQGFLNSIEHFLNQLQTEASDTESSITQRRADAAVLMAESSLQASGRDIATSDRYQVIVSVDAAELSDPKNHQPSNAELTPAKRPTVKGAGPIGCETARRIACDCSVTNNDIKNGEPIDIGRKSRLWPPAMARAIKNRDQHCQFNGCTQTKNLQVHHIIHRADGGSTSVDNGVSVCQKCHTKLHEGGYSIQRVNDVEPRVNEQFSQQQHTNNNLMFNFEKELRDNRASFNNIRLLSPTRYRFRVLDPEGRDIRNTEYSGTTGTTDCTCRTSFAKSDARTSFTSRHSTRGECGTPSVSVCGRADADASKSGSSGIGERSGDYCAELPGAYCVEVYEIRSSFH